MKHAMIFRHETYSVHVPESTDMGQDLNHLRDMLLDGARSSPSGPADDRYFASLRDVIKNRLTARSSRVKDSEE
jgi:hypothetical protein